MVSLYFSIRCKELHFVAEMAAPEALKDGPQGYGKPVFILDPKSYIFSQKQVHFYMIHQFVGTWKACIYTLVSIPLMKRIGYMPCLVGLMVVQTTKLLLW